ncbi:MAG: PP2C family protein-serine/threonine phosphatase [Planctomycetes bacterium]|nr:PP2C family protein-serine/threonine phosphatase [Planctomycetota bacterium]
MLSDRISALVRSGNAEEFVKMVDNLTIQLDAAGIPTEERARRMSQLLKLLPVAEQVQKLRRVLLVQEDPALVSEWGTALSQGGFEVVPVPTTDAALEKLKDGSHWSGLVADAGFRGAAGVKFLADAAGAGRRPVPVALLSWDEALKELKPVKDYPNLRFIVQPVEPPAIATTLDEIALPPEITRPSPSEVAADPKLALELRKAHDIQVRLLPSEIPQPAGFEIAARYQPAGDVGGDYYDVIPLPNGRVGLLVADVSGKGLSAAMVMVIARTVFHAVAPECFTPRNAVLQAAERMAADLPPGVFLTLVYAVLDPGSGTVSVANCGHNAPLLATRFNGTPIVETVDASGGALGVVRGGAFERSLKTCDVQLEPGEHFILYTDGVNEAMNELEEEFGDHRLMKTINQKSASSAADLAEGLVQTVVAHRGAADPSDDLTLLVVRRSG